MDGDLTFFGWQRSGIYDDPPREAGPDQRLRRKVGLSLQGSDGKVANGEISFLVMNLTDVTGIQPQAVARTMPRSNSRNVETTKCVYVEFAAPDLPWRYTQEASAGAALRPWIALVVGIADEVILQTNGKVTLKGDPSDLHDVLKDHDLSKSALRAHVQFEDGKYIARLLSSRALQPNKDYVAAIVPVGSLTSWGSNGEVTLDCYYSWTFQTGNEGDFKSLAAQLKPGIAEAVIGSATVNYNRPGVSEALSVRGALTRIASQDPILSPNVAADLAVLTRRQFDPLGRPVISMPRYGAAWVSDPEQNTWAATLNDDPRHRGVAGLGLGVGIALQELIMDAAAKQIGALDIAAQRIRHLTLGLQANRSLWLRRLPKSPEHRLLIYGPSLRRIVTDRGPVLDQIAGGDRPLPPNIFSTAARRVLRKGPARTSLASADATKPSNLLRSANTCASVGIPNPKGLPHVNSAPGAPDSADQDNIPPECISFRGLPMGFGPNPRTERGVKFEVKDGQGNPLIESRIGTWETDPDQLAPEKMALAFGKELEITLPAPASRIELTMRHVNCPCIIVAINEDETSAGWLGMRNPMDEPETFTISGTSIKRVVITATIGVSTYLHDFCYKNRGPIAALDDLIQKTLNTGSINHQPLLDFLNGAIANPPSDPATGPRDPSSLREIRDEFFKSVHGLHVPTKNILDLIESFRTDDNETFRAKIRDFRTSPAMKESDDQSILNLGRALLTAPPNRRCRPVDLRALESALTAAIDPTVASPFVQSRVLTGISGLTGPPLAPPEICVGLDLPVWGFLRDSAPDWLLPGVASLKKDSVIALQSNPRFVDAFLLGINTQVLNELRWRNMKIATGCTPIKMFWGQLNADDQRERDILGVEVWRSNSELGDDSHRTTSARGEDLVLVVRGDLLRRYPETLVYIFPSVLKADGSPDWSVGPELDANRAKDRVLPTFQGSIGEDIVFFRFPVDARSGSKQWIVFEEFPTAYSFFNSADQIRVDNDPAKEARLRSEFAGASNGAQFAAAAFADPLRVLVRGDKIIPAIPEA